MKAVILSSVPRERRTIRAALAVLDWELEKVGYDTIARFDVRSSRIRFGKALLDESIGSPDAGAAQDSERSIAAAIGAADALILVGPIARGGLDPELERAVECLSRLVPSRRPSPNDERAGFLTLLSVGVLSSRDDTQATTFVALNEANAVSFRASVRRAAVLDEEHTEAWQEQLRVLIGAETEPESTQRRGAGRPLPRVIPTAPPR